MTIGLTVSAFTAFSAVIRSNFQDIVVVDAWRFVLGRADLGFCTTVKIPCTFVTIKTGNERKSMPVTSRFGYLQPT